MLSGPTCHAQDSVEVAVLHPQLGGVISRMERDRYKLFTQVPNFHNAVIYHLPDDSFLVSIYMRDESNAMRDTAIFYSRGYLFAKAEQIAHYAQHAAGQYKMGTDPVRALSQLPAQRVAHEREDWKEIIQDALRERDRKRDVFDAKKRNVAAQKRIQDSLQQQRKRARLSDEDVGQRIVKVFGRDGTEYEGPLLSVREASILLDANWPYMMDHETGLTDSTMLGTLYHVDGEYILSVNKTEIAGIELVGASNVLQGMALGTLIGIAVGAGVGGIMVAGQERYDSHGHERDWYGIEILAGGILGGLTGLFSVLIAGAATSEPDIEFSSLHSSDYDRLKHYARYPEQEPVVYEVVR